MYGEVVRVSAPVGVLSSSSFRPTRHAQLTVRFLIARIPLDIRSKDPSVHLPYIWLQLQATQREDCRRQADVWGRIVRGRRYVLNIHVHHTLSSSGHLSFSSSEPHVVFGYTVYRRHPQKAEEDHAAGIREVRIKSTHSNF